VNNDIEVSVTIDAAPATVFEFLVDPDKHLEWMGVSAKLDPRPGGEYRVDVTGGDVAVGEFVIVEPDERVVFTFGWDGNDGLPPGSSTVEITLTPAGDSTVVTLHHTGLPDADSCARHRAGWTHYSERLRVRAAGGDPGPDSNRRS
jgi:uncharacterized protein YndB with AHSA1/START domain